MWGVNGILMNLNVFKWDFLMVYGYLIHGLKYHGLTWEADLLN